MSNVDKYKYVTVVDNDETLLPPRLNPIHGHDQLLNELYTNSFDTPLKAKLFGQNLDCQRFNHINPNITNNSLIESYIEYLTNAKSLVKQMSYNFDQVFFLKGEMIQIFFKQFFNLFLSNTNSKRGYKNDTRNGSYPIKININNLKKKNKKGLEDFDYTFLIRNENDFNYTINLFNLNRWLIQPFLRQHHVIINKTCDRYDRVFALSSFSNSNPWSGKTIHNTQTTFTLTLHLPYKRDFIRVPYRHGYLSHFRGYYHLLKDKKPIPINELFIDLNYFVCYFKPIV
jgi:hypothetical protein